MRWEAWEKNQEQSQENQAPRAGSLNRLAQKLPGIRI